MKLVPLFKVRDMRKAIAFYTEVLDFTLKYPQASPEDGVVTVVHGDAELELTIYEGDYLFGSVVNVLVNEVDELFKKFLSRGYITPKKQNSPVDEGPIDQSWGMREFYIRDLDCNTLRYGKPIGS